MEQGLGAPLQGIVTGADQEAEGDKLRGKSLINFISHVAGTYSSRPAFPQICTCSVTTSNFIRGSCLRA